MRNASACTLAMIVVVGCGRPAPASVVAACAVSTATVDSTTRTQLIEARDAVWRAYYAGDSARLAELLPEPMVGMGQTRAEIIAESQAYARAGNRLVGITFTCDEFFLSGDVAVVYSNYRVERNSSGKPGVDAGRAIEVFERRNGKWVNPSWHLDES